MKRRLLPFLVVLAVLTSGLPLAWGAHSFESMPYTDELNDFIRAFGDLIDQVEQRLNQAVALYNRDDVYDSPYVRVNVQNNKVPNIKKSLERSAEAKK